jgi:hypothetical protein
MPIILLTVGIVSLAFAALGWLADRRIFASGWRRLMRRIRGDAV